MSPNKQKGEKTNSRARGWPGFPKIAESRIEERSGAQMSLLVRSVLFLLTCFCVCCVLVLLYMCVSCCLCLCLCLLFSIEEIDAKSPSS